MEIALHYEQRGAGGPLVLCPTLVVAGKRDIIKQEHTRLIARPIPGAVLAVLPGPFCGQAERRRI